MALPEFSWSVGLAVIIALFLTLTQVMSTYPGFEFEVHKTPATFALYTVNALIVIGVVTATWFANPDSDWWTTGVAVGFGLPVIVQSKFTLTKPLGDRSFAGSVVGEMSIDISTYYSVYAGVFRREMDAAIEIAFQRILRPILDRFPDAQGVTDLGNRATDALDARNLLTDQKQRYEKQIADILASGSTHERKKRLLAREILSLMGRKYLEGLR